MSTVQPVIDPLGLGGLGLDEDQLSSMVVDKVLNTDTHPSDTKPWLWKPGQSGNARGRPSRGVTINDLSNIMAHWSRPKLQAVMDDPEAEATRVAAARHVMDMTAQGFAKSGKPFAMEDLREALDRGLGKPTQSILAQVLTTEVKRIVLVDEPGLIGGTARAGILPLVDAVINKDADTQPHVLPGPKPALGPGQPGSVAAPVLALGGIQALTAPEPVQESQDDISQPRTGEIQGKAGSIELMCKKK